MMLREVDVEEKVECLFQPRVVTLGKFRHLTFNQGANLARRDIDRRVPLKQITWISSGSCSLKPVPILLMPPATLIKHLLHLESGAPVNDIGGIIARDERAFACPDSKVPDEVETRLNLALGLALRTEILNRGLESLSEVLKEALAHSPCRHLTQLEGTALPNNLAQFAVNPGRLKGRFRLTLQDVTSQE